MQKYHKSMELLPYCDIQSSVMDYWEREHVEPGLGCWLDLQIMHSKMKAVEYGLNAHNKINKKIKIKT